MKKTNKRKSTKPPKEKLTFRDFERMMTSANTYERRGGKVRQKRSSS